MEDEQPARMDVEDEQPAVDEQPARTDEQLLFEQARAAMAAGRYTDAVQLLRQLAAMTLGDAAVHAEINGLVASCLRSMGRLGEAVALCERVLTQPGLYGPLRLAVKQTLALASDEMFWVAMASSRLPAGMVLDLLARLVRAFARKYKWSGFFLIYVLIHVKDAVD